MATKKKLLQAAAGAAGGEVLDITNVFSTFLYNGTGSAQTITNGIDLTEGGLVWTKRRDATGDSVLYDTERGVSGNDALRANTDGAAFSGSMSSFNNNGFTLDSNSASNTSGAEMLSFTFRKAENFFTIVEWTGDGASNQTIAHDLGATPDLIITKNKSFGSGVISWWTPTRRRFKLDNAQASNAASTFDEGSVTSRTNTHFYVNKQGNGYSAGRSGDTFVSYLFAGHDGDGTFGPNADQDIIKIGQYTGDGTTNGTNQVTLGFEPQLLFIKNISNTTESRVINNISGFGVELSKFFKYEEDSAESNIGHGITSTGFALRNSSLNANGNLYAYMAIRRGPLAEPESATDVFAMDVHGSAGDSLAPAFRSGFPVDMSIRRNIASSDDWDISGRLTQGKYLKTNSSSAEVSESSELYDFMNGWWNSTATNNNLYGWMWKRAPSFCDVVAYTGNGTAGRTVSHNLGVAPEMIWVKQRNANQSWQVYHSGMDATAPEDYYMILDSTASRTDHTLRWNDTAPTSSVFTVGSGSAVNGSSDTYVAFLFSSLAGISKVGSYTGNGSSLNVDCGFSSGARFVMVKRTDSSGGWAVFDTERGIVSGNDSFLQINANSAQFTTYDNIDPYSSGFTILNGIGSTNVSGATYIFYAIA